MTTLWAVAYLSTRTDESGQLRRRWPSRAVAERVAAQMAKWTTEVCWAVPVRVEDES